MREFSPNGPDNTSQTVKFAKTPSRIYRFGMSENTVKYDTSSVEQLARIIDRARTTNGVSTQVSRGKLSADLAAIQRVFSEAGDPSKPREITDWDLIAEENPPPTQRHKIFAKCLKAKDPLAELRKLSHGRSPSEMYFLQKRINSRARSKLPNVEKSLPKLDTADWNGFSKEQKENIFLHLIRLESHFLSQRGKTPNPKGLLINDAILELANIFAAHTEFDGIDTDLPYSAESRFVGFVQLALTPFVAPKKLTAGAISKRWGRIKGLDIS